MNRRPWHRQKAVAYSAWLLEALARGGVRIEVVTRDGVMMTTVYDPAGHPVASFHGTRIAS